MKVVGLLSGGKDSCFNLCHCVINGHQLVALASLGPETGKEELDSYLYQTVGQDAIHLVAEALRLPLYRRTIKGTPVELGPEYGSRSSGCLLKGLEGDETEDLYHLLNEVKSTHPDITAVSVGAILSNYQRVRVEYVCQRLGLSVFAFLWQRDQSELLREMIHARIESVLIKVASVGLLPEHLGKNLSDMQPTLEALNSKFGVHVCGEGGEYETYTVDCPLFHSRILLENVLLAYHQESSPIAPVAYLRLLSAKLHPKSIGISKLEDVVVPPLLDSESVDIINRIEAFIVKGPRSTHLSFDHSKYNPPSVAERAGWVIISSILDPKPSQQSNSLINEVEEAFNHLAGLLEKFSLSFVDIAHINLYLSSMDYFSQVNNVYASKFGTSPPTRACVASILPGQARVMIDVIAHRPIEAQHPQARKALHVQSRSYWAPANIGPYSQAVMIGGKIFVAGQIGLIPSTLTLPSPPSFLKEAVLSLQHARRILATFPNPQWIEGIVCYLEDAAYLEQARTVWNHSRSIYHKHTPVLFLEVSQLPKGASIEWQLMVGTDPRSDNHDDDDPCSGPEYFSDESTTFNGCGFKISQNLTAIGAAKKDSVVPMKLPHHSPTYIRGFYTSRVSYDEAVKMIRDILNLSSGQTGSYALSLLCVHSIGLNVGPLDWDVGFYMMGSLE